MQYTEQQIREAFYKRYQDEHNGSLLGVEPAFEWWLHPMQKCLVKAKGGPRCKMICATCKGMTL